MKINYLNLEKKIKINFKNKDLLIKSLTHKSFDKENNNEKIEFLGDRVLGLIISDEIFHSYPDDSEGNLAKKISFLVCKNTLIKIADDLRLEKHFIISKNIIKNGFNTARQGMKLFF